MPFKLEDYDYGDDLSCEGCLCCRADNCYRGADSDCPINTRDGVYTCPCTEA